MKIDCLHVRTVQYHYCCKVEVQLQFKRGVRWQNGLETKMPSDHVLRTMYVLGKVPMPT